MERKRFDGQDFSIVVLKMNETEEFKTVLKNDNGSSIEIFSGSYSDAVDSAFDLLAQVFNAVIAGARKINSSDS